MNIIPYPIDIILCSVFLALLCLVLLLNIFGLPANWVILGLDFLWDSLHPGSLGFLFWSVAIFMAVCGEGLEFGLQIVKARKYGSSSSGTFGGLIGGIVGAILLAPLFWGIGAFIGALAGAWTGCFLMELARGNSGKAAREAAFGTMLGRFLGTICKIGIGGAIIAFTAHFIWPALPQMEPVLPDELLAFAFIWG